MINRCVKCNKPCGCVMCYCEPCMRKSGITYKQFGLKESDVK
jgi:hypothetical protein